MKIHVLLFWYNFRSKVKFLSLRMKHKTNSLSGDKTDI